MERDEADIVYEESVDKELVDNLKIPKKSKRVSDVYATLHIHLDILSDEQIAKIRKGVRLLHDGGLNFDEGFGEGNYELNFDWSLAGGHLKLQKMYCHNCKVNLDGKDITFGRAEDKLLIPFCCTNCVEHYKDPDDVKIIGLIEANNGKKE